LPDSLPAALLIRAIRPVSSIASSTRILAIACGYEDADDLDTLRHDPGFKLALANDTDYGLSAAIISKDVGRAIALGDRLHSGLLHINDQTVNDEVVNPFGGVGASGNGTSIGGPPNWELFTDWQWITIKGKPPAFPF
jgi:hypothetical protein